jgi:hypothetical protein
MPAPLPVNWDTAKSVVEAGVPIREASERLGIPYDTLRKRAQRERWITEARLKTAIQARQAAKSSACPNVPESVPESIIAASLEESGTEVRRTALAIARNELNRVSQSGTLRIENWSDFRIATEMGLKAAGLDQNNAPPVQILITDAPARVVDT